jgi:hypothetical protein
MDYQGVLSPVEVMWFSLAILLTFTLLVAVFFIGTWVTRNQIALSPYTKKPLRLGSNIPYQTAEKVLRYLFFMRQYDNRMFDVRKAAFCRETGRLFPNAVSYFDTIHVDWTFLEKRYPGSYVSWGSLSEEQQEMIKRSHHHLDGYQTEFSSRKSAPSQIEPEYAYKVPGPLYVDLETRVLLGWKIVPETELEVLIVQKPKGRFELPR